MYRKEVLTDKYSYCPTCESPLNRYTLVGEKPELELLGAIGLCGFCGCVFKYTKEALVVATLADLAELPASERELLENMRHVWKEKTPQA